MKILYRNLEVCRYAKYPGVELKTCTVKPVNKDHSRDQKNVVIISRWPLLTGELQ